MIDEETRKAIAKRRDKAIAVILRAKEDECDEYLPSDVGVRFRKIILDQINEFHEMTLEIFKFSSSSRVNNDLYLEKLDEILDRLGD